MALLKIRSATVADAGLILQFIRELAIYEKAEHAVQTDEIGIAESLFGADATARALICEADGEAIGYAVYFYNYSTWLGRKGIYLEDLYVSPQKRGSGAGKALLKYIARQAVAEGCGRFEWSVLDWNTPAIEFYIAVGAKPQDEWTVYRLQGQALHLVRISPTVEAKCIHAWRGSTNRVGANRNPVGANLGSHSLRTQKKATPNTGVALLHAWEADPASIRRPCYGLPFSSS